MTVVRIRPSVVEGRIVAPPSKSYTHRFLLAAHLSGRRARVVRPLQSDDTVRTARGLGPLGSHVVRTRGVWTVTPRPIRTSAALRTVDCGESGTTLRLLTAIAARQEGPTRFVGSGRLPRRPMAPLFEALSALGAKVETAGPTRALPFQISGPIHGGNVALAVDTSSQFTSALLLALPTLPEDSRLRDLQFALIRYVAGRVELATLQSEAALSDDPVKARRIKEVEAFHAAQSERVRMLLRELY